MITALRSSRRPLAARELVTAVSQQDESIGRPGSYLQVHQLLHRNPQLFAEEEPVAAARRASRWTVRSEAVRAAQRLLSQELLEWIQRGGQQQAPAGLEQVLGLLRPGERSVLTLRYGLAEGRRRSHREVAGELQLSGTRVRQLEASALRKLSLASTAD
jgi:hypothetical protein